MGDLKYFSKIYDKKFLDKIAEKGNKRGVQYFLTNMAAQPWRREFNKYIRYVQQHGAIVEQLKKRLRSLEWDVFHQVWGELMAGYFFEKHAKLQTKYRPEGKKGKLGDWLIIPPNHAPIFVEVKSPWEERGEGGPYNNVPKIKQQLKTAYKQIPGNGPAMVVIISKGFNVSPTDEYLGVEEALYGTERIIVPTEKPSQGAWVERWRNGFFQPRQHRNLSAVGFLDCWPLENKFNYVFNLYHNPHAQYPIEHRIKALTEKFSNLYRADDH